jgi:hypothetical protein
MSALPQKGAIVAGVTLGSESCQQPTFAKQHRRTVRSVFMQPAQIKKNPAVAAAMTAVASHPPTSMGRGNVSRPIMRGFMAIIIMTAISGVARTPLTTALQ